MKVNLGIAITVILIILACFLVYINKYKSAFEADQACHSQKWESYAESSAYGCDHDIETRQWILYENGIDQKPAKVIQRYRY